MLRLWRAEEPYRVVVENLSFCGFVRRQPADPGEDLRAITFGPLPDSVIAVGAEQQFVLMLRDEPTGVGFVACLEIEP